MSLRRTLLKRRTQFRPRARGSAEKKRLDERCRAIIFARDPACCRCGRSENGQWCHILSRRYHSARWRLENSLRLCAGCHLWWHHQPLQAVRWFEQKYPDRAKVLHGITTFPQKVDLKLEHAYLNAVAQLYGL